MHEQQSPLVAIAAFGGWNDAGEASTGAIDHLLSVWPRRRLAVIGAEEYVDFQVNRPSILTEGDGTRGIEWPDTFVELVSPPRGRPFILIHGPEPSTRWRTYCREVLAPLQEAGVSTLVCLGALLADAPHTRPLPVSVALEGGPDAQADPSAYEGPIGVPTILARSAVAAGMRAVSVWAQVPHYVSQNSAPKAVLALLREVQDHLDAAIPLSDLEEEAAAWQRGVDELARTDPDIADYVAGLERAQDAAELPDASGDAIAREFEQFLRRRDDDD